MHDTSNSKTKSITILKYPNLTITSEIVNMAFKRKQEHVIYMLFVNIHKECM